MKNSIQKVFIFLLPIFLAWGFVEYFYQTAPNNYTSKHENINQNTNEIEVLLFGSSHCLYGLNPEFFLKNTFNLSGISQTIYFDKLLLEKYMDHLPKLKQVVFCIEYSNLSQKDNTQEDAFRKYYYERFMDLDVPIVSNYDPKKYSLALTRSLGASLDLMSKYYKKGTILNCDAKGWGNDYKKANRISPDIVAKERAAAHEDGSTDFTLNKSRINYLIQECKKRNIEVLIVSMPVSKAYSENLNQEKLQLIFDTCKELETSNIDNVYYLNLFNDRRFVDEDFFDADHLNEIGAEKCSKIVNTFCK